MLDWIAFILITISTIGLLIIPLFLDNQIKGFDEIKSNFETIFDKLRDFRFRHSQALKEYDELNLIYEIYRNSVSLDKQLDFIQSNIKSRLKDAYSFILTWNEQANNELDYIDKYTTKELFGKINLNQVLFAKRLDELQKLIKHTQSRRDRVELVKKRIVIICVIINTLGLVSGFLSTQRSNNETKAIQKEILIKIQRPTQAHTP